MLGSCYVVYGHDFIYVLWVIVTDCNLIVTGCVFLRVRVFPGVGEEGCPWLCEGVASLC